MAISSDVITAAIDHHRAGRLQEAEILYRQILQAEPGHADVWRLLGVLATQAGQHDGAVECLERSLQLNPTSAEALHHLGLALRKRGQLADAIACFQRSLQIEPDDSAVLNNLGLALHEHGELESAIACFQRALQRKPEGDATLLYNLGNSFLKRGQLPDAVACFQRAVQINPGFVQAHNNLGNAWKQQRRPAEAIACYRRALELMPGLAETHGNLGAAFMDQARIADAIACYRQALRLKPDYVQVHSNLLYALHFDPAQDPRTIYEEHCRFDEQHAAKFAASIRPHANDRSPQRRLRVGYVSPDFRMHSQANFTVPLFAAHNHEQFETIGYADVVRPDQITARLQSYADGWRSIVGFSDEQVAELIRQDRIDILVDLTMHLTNNRPLMFARKPAPVQVCWLAYQGTTGLKAIDYRLTDPHLDPPGLDDQCYSEESIRLADSFWCYDPLTSEPQISSLPSLASGHITFGSFNNFCKVNSLVIALWARVLVAVANSRLLLLAPEGSERERTLTSFAQEGIAPERVTFVPFCPRAQYLEIYRRIDIGLDTFPYNGQTTSLDSFWLGVPVVTITGKTAAARAGASLLLNLGLPELIAQTPEQFVQIATELAGDLPRLAQLRASLRERLENSPLMDAPRFAKSVETVYRSMWQRWCAQRLP